MPERGFDDEKLNWDDCSSYQIHRFKSGIWKQKNYFLPDKTRCKILSLNNDTISEDEESRDRGKTTKTIQSICI